MSSKRVWLGFRNCEGSSWNSGIIAVIFCIFGSINFVLNIFCNNDLSSKRVWIEGWKLRGQPLYFRHHYSHFLFFGATNFVLSNFCYNDIFSRRVWFGIGNCEGNNCISGIITVFFFFFFFFGATSFILNNFCSFDMSSKRVCLGLVNWGGQQSDFHHHHGHFLFVFWCHKFSPKQQFITFFTKLHSLTNISRA